MNEKELFKCNFKYMLDYGSLWFHFKECFYYQKWCWVKLKPKDRFLGFEFIWYDGPFYSFGFWYFCGTAHWVIEEPKSNALNFIQEKTLITKLKNIYRRFKSWIGKK